MGRKRNCMSSHFPFQTQIKGFHFTGVVSILGAICFPWALLVQEVVFCTKSSGQKTKYSFLATHLLQKQNKTKQRQKKKLKK